MSIWRDRRISISVTLLVVAILANSFAPRLTQTVRTRTTMTSYPAATCPAPAGGEVGRVYLANSAMKIRAVAKNSTGTQSARSTSVAVSKPLFIDGTPLTTLMNSSGNGSGAIVACTPGIVDEWFVGGSGALGSQSTIQLVNSGLSESVVDLIAYASKGALPVLSVHIPANSEKDISVDAMAPGESAVAIHAITRAGRTTTFLYDHRQKGLHSLGGDYVAPIFAPARSLVIAGGISSSSTAQVLRLAVPGTVNANVAVNVISKDGSFIPVGLDSVVVKHENVLDIALKNFQSATYFSLSISSDQPVLASLLTATSSEIGWSPASAPLEVGHPLTFNMGGNKAGYIFTGPDVSIHISWRSTAGKSGNITLRDKAFVAWAPSAPLSLLQISSDNPGTYGSAAISTSPGFSYLPLTSGSQLESASVPQSDARTISRG